MAGRPTLWGAKEFLKSFFGQTTNPPANFYLALVQETPPNPFISGTELDEPVGMAYARKVIPNNSTNWSNTGITNQLHLVSNQLELAFTAATGEWGAIGYWALCDASTAGNVYFYGQLEQPVFIGDGDQAIVPALDLVIELGPFK